MLKSLFVSAILMFSPVFLYAQLKIDTKDISKHVGDSVIICAKIYGGKYLDAANNKPTFLNMGAAYPNQLLTLVIWGNIRTSLNYKPEEKLKGKTVCVTGKIELFKNKPQIVIYNTAQLHEQ